MANDERKNLSDEREEREERVGREGGASHHEPHDREHEPPHTTTGKVTSPKFGSAGSGGAELEPIDEE